MTRKKQKEKKVCKSKDNGENFNDIFTRLVAKINQGFWWIIYKLFEMIGGWGNE